MRVRSLGVRGGWCDHRLGVRLAIGGALGEDPHDGCPFLGEGLAVGVLNRVPILRAIYACSAEVVCSRGALRGIDREIPASLGARPEFNGTQQVQEAQTFPIGLHGHW